MSKIVPPAPPFPARLYSLDALRGVAAMTVVLWHWQHFYAMTGAWQIGWRHETEPFFAILRPFYLEGWAAVDLFFALSGFVFYWLYAGPIAEARIAPAGFALKRLSRLYPLHVLTLLCVVGLQIAFRALNDTDFIYRADNPGQFVAQLLLGQQWLPPTMEQTFNGPAWTVSVEAGMYAIFFLLCRKAMGGVKPAIVLVATGIALMWWNELIGRGVIGFFLGGAVYHAVARWRLRPDAPRLARNLRWTAVLLWAAAFAEIRFAPLQKAIVWVLTQYAQQSLPLYWGAKVKLFLILYVLTVVPITLAALALGESLPGGRAPGRLCKMLSKLGDISFSTYMLHFPLQLLFVLVALQMDWTTGVFENPATMLIFYAILLGLSTASWRYFEGPVQRTIRDLAKQAVH